MTNAARADRERWELDQRRADVLLVGSQLAYGSVGTNAALPVLNEAGLRVVPLPTVLLSNLPHHRSVHAITLPPEWLRSTLDDLTALGVAAEIDTICTGYFAEPAQVEAVAGWIRTALASAPGLRVIVDPTLGDHDVGPY
ncbi:MAG: pyridoxal kinase, partial [Actinomycetes bacterium]